MFYLFLWRVQKSGKKTCHKQELPKLHYLSKVSVKTYRMNINAWYFCFTNHSGQITSLYSVARAWRFTNKQAHTQKCDLHRHKHTPSMWRYKSLPSINKLATKSHLCCQKWNENNPSPPDPFGHRRISRGFITSSPVYFSAQPLNTQIHKKKKTILFVCLNLISQRITFSWKCLFSTNTGPPNHPGCLPASKWDT